MGMCPYVHVAVCTSHHITEVVRMMKLDIHTRPISQPQSAQSHTHLYYLHWGVYVVCFSTSPGQAPAVTSAQGHVYTL